MGLKTGMDLRIVQQTEGLCDNLQISRRCPESALPGRRQQPMRCPRI